MLVPGRVFIIRWLTIDGKPLPDMLAPVITGQDIAELKKRAKSSGRPLPQFAALWMSVAQPGDRCKFLWAMAAYRLDIEVDPADDWHSFRGKTRA